MSDLLAALRADYCRAGCNPTSCLCALCESAADEIERLRAAMTWQPMETAPQDGRPILMACVGGLPERMCWIDGPGLTPGWYLTDRRPREAAWFVRPERARAWRWMPLPEPPPA